MAPRSGRRINGRREPLRWRLSVYPPSGRYAALIRAFGNGPPISMSIGFLQTGGEHGHQDHQGHQDGKGRRHVVGRYLEPAQECDDRFHRLRLLRSADGEQQHIQHRWRYLRGLWRVRARTAHDGQCRPFRPVAGIGRDHHGWNGSARCRCRRSDPRSAIRHPVGRRPHDRRCRQERHDRRDVRYLRNGNDPVFRRYRR